MITSRLSSIARPLVLRVDAEHLGVGGELPGPTPKDTRPRVRWSSCTMRDGEDQRVVVGERGHPGAEAEVLGALGGGGDELDRVGDDLPAGGVVLADPRLLDAELVEVLHQREVAVEGEGGVLVRGVERGEEDPEPQGPLGGDGVTPRRGRAAAAVIQS